MGGTTSTGAGAPTGQVPQQPTQGGGMGGNPLSAAISAQGFNFPQAANMGQNSAPQQQVPWANPLTGQAPQQPTPGVGKRYSSLAEALIDMGVDPSFLYGASQSRGGGAPDTNAVFSPSQAGISSAMQAASSPALPQTPGLPQAGNAGLQDMINRSPILQSVQRQHAGAGSPLPLASGVSPQPLQSLWGGQLPNPQSSWNVPSSPQALWSGQPSRNASAISPMSALGYARGGRVGPLDGRTPGRADKLPMNVPNGAHVIPADVVSALGQGNTMAGHKVLGRIFPNSAHTGFAKGGSVPIKASDGEFIVSPHDVMAKGRGDPRHGHKVIDAFILGTRHDYANNLRRLPGPRG